MKLRVANMVCNPSLVKSISDAGCNQFLTIVSAKAEEAGLPVVVVNPAGTSQTCSGCGRSVRKDLTVRWHTCPYEDCGLSLQRDHNPSLSSTGPGWAVPWLLHQRQSPRDFSLGSVNLAARSRRPARHESGRACRPR